MKILKNVKALSPVIATIILIAVTVAVSIAVAAWMGALTIGFMSSESVTITNTVFNGTSGTAPNYIVIYMKNTGTKQVTLGQVKVNSAICTVAPAANMTLTTTALNQKLTITMPTATPWSNGNAYQINLFDASGNPVGSTQRTAPVF
jgi:flagellin-like protein